MAKFSLIGATVSIAGVLSCVESGDIDLGELNLVETTCSTDTTKTYVAGTHNAASGSVMLNSTDALSDWLAAYEGADPDVPPLPVPVILTWPDTGAAAVTVSAIIQNASFPVGVDQAVKTTFKFSGVAALAFVA